MLEGRKRNFFLGCAVWAYKGWVIQIKQWLQEGKQIYFFVHCPIEERSPHNARYFQKLLEESNVSIPPLPWNNLDCPPQQLNLW